MISLFCIILQILYEDLLFMSIFGQDVEIAAALNERLHRELVQVQALGLMQAALTKGRFSSGTELIAELRASRVPRRERGSK